MWDDPIVREVREAADKLARETSYDLHEFCRRVREHESNYADRLVTLPPRKLDLLSPARPDTSRES